jgi:hypothetical protein
MEPASITSCGVWHRAVGRRKLGQVLGLAAAFGCLLAVGFTSRASASSFTWTGTDPSSAGWSAASNWQGDVAPASPIEELDFPQLSGECEQNEPNDPCYISENDLSNPSVETLRIDDGKEYLIAGNRFSLGSGGLKVAPTGGSSEPALAAILQPIALSASQTWTIAGAGEMRFGENTLYLEEELSGSSHELHVDMSNGGGLALGSGGEIGPLTIEGANEGAIAGPLNGTVSLFGGRLNSVDGEPVHLKHVFLYGAGATGPLTGEAAEIAIASGEQPGAGSLQAPSIKLASASWLALEISGEGSTAGKDYAQLRSTGAVELAGAKLEVDVLPPAAKKSCPVPTAGTVYTLISTSGTLSGEFTNAPAGTEIPIHFGKSCAQQPPQKLLVAYHTAGAVQTVTGTVIVPTSTTTLSASPTTPVTNQLVTLRATVAASEGLPAGSVEFRDGASQVTGCQDEPVEQGSPAVATCQTSFPATAHPDQLSAVFKPSSPASLRGSEGTTELTVAKSATTTTLQSSSSLLTVGGTVTYTAAVTPVSGGPVQPVGTVEFLDGGTPVDSCMHQSLAAGQATCQLSYSAAATHSLTARFAGDGNFLESSSSPAQAITVQPASPGVSQEAGPPPVSGSAPEPVGVTLHGATLAVSGGEAGAELNCGASGGCHGKLTLTARESSRRNGHRHTRTVTIATASFKIGGDSADAVKLALNAIGRALLASDHGHLGAQLTILQITPMPTRSHSTGVQLVERAPRRHGSRRRR